MSDLSEKVDKLSSDVQALIDLHKVEIGKDLAEEAEERHFYKEAWFKVIENLVSVKVWGLACFTTISTIMVFTGYLYGSDWIQGNGTVYSIIYGMREVFKTAKIKRLSKNAAKNTMV